MNTRAKLAGSAESRSASAGYHVETLDDFESFLRLEPIWNDLIEQSGITFPFVTHEWVRSWFEHFGAGQRIHLLLVKSGKTIVGIVPLMLQPGWMYGLPVMRLQSIHNVYTERFDFIINGPAEEIYATIWNHLRSQEPRWDVLELRQVPANSPTLTHLTRLATADRHRTERWRSCDSPYLSVDGSWDGYRQKLDRKHRANLRNRLDRLCRMGNVEVEVIEKPEQTHAALEEGWALEAAAWKGQAGTAIGCLPDARGFYEAFAMRAARRGWLRLYFLKINGRRIAFCYGLCYRNRTFELKPGYDPRYAPFSPSTTLCSMMIEQAFRHGQEEVDFLGANDGWKRSWTPTTRPHDWLFVFRPGVRSRLVRWAKFRLAPVLRGTRRTA
ncbi:MAG TPA: GNAT family N-acetyltransferase [Patescibacteria group bacterium]|jgi:CelD/BcsL family acetyltransferase involved in cellulose biosynthesis|nr:GNAT family N-acetyltransferase [Patescibacteria group bacterium]